MATAQALSTESGPHTVRSGTTERPGDMVSNGIIDSIRARPTLS